MELIFQRLLRRGLCYPHAAGIEIEHHIDLADDFIGSVEIALINDEQVADLEDTCLDGLNIIAHPRNQDDHRRVSCLDNIDFRLTDTDGLDDDDVLSKSIHRLDDVRRLMGKTTKTAARSHGADEYAFIKCQVIHADAVAQDGTACKRTRGIDGDDAYGHALLAIGAGDLIRHRRLAGTRRARDANDIRVPCMCIQFLHDVVGFRILVFDRGDRPRECEPVACREFLCNIQNEPLLSACFLLLTFVTRTL